MKTCLLIETFVLSIRFDLFVVLYTASSRFLHFPEFLSVLSAVSACLSAAFLSLTRSVPAVLLKHVLIARMIGNLWLKYSTAKSSCFPLFRTLPFSASICCKFLQSVFKNNMKFALTRFAFLINIPGLSWHV